MEKKVYFYSEGFKIAATLYLPEDLKRGQKRGAIVCCRGYGSNARDREPLMSFYKYFCKKGYIALSLDYRGFGESEGPRWRMIPWDEVEDVRSAITFLQQQKQVNPEKIGIWGSSFGGAISVATAAVDKRVKAAVANVPVANGERWLRSLRNNWEWKDFVNEIKEDRARKVLTGKSKMVDWMHIMPADPDTTARIKQLCKQNPDFYVSEQPLETADAIMEFSPDELAPRISPRAILFTVAENDLITPPDLCKEVYDKALEPKKYVMVPGVDHESIYVTPWREIVMEEAFNWFNKYMPLAEG